VLLEYDSLAKLSSAKGLTEGPASWGNIVGDHATTVTSGDLEGEGLAVEVGVALPILAPIP